MNDVSITTFWDWLAQKSKKNLWVNREDMMAELGLDLHTIIFYIKELKENNLLKTQKDDNKISYQIHLKLSPNQVSGANYIGIGMRNLEKYCILDLKNTKNILMAAANFDDYKEKQKKDLIEKMHKEKFEQKLENVQKTNQDLFSLLNLADEIINGSDKTIEKEVAKSIKKEIQDLVKLLVKS